MVQTFKNVFAMLDRTERFRALMLVMLLALLAAIEVAGVASVMPLLLVLGNPGLVETNPYLNAIYTRLGFTKQQTFLIALALACLGFLISVSVARGIIYYVKFRFANMRRHAIAMRLLTVYLHQPYEFFLSRSTSGLAKTVLSEVDEIVESAITPTLIAISHGLVALALALFLLVIDPVLGLVASSVAGSLFALVYLSTRRILIRNGENRLKANTERFQAVSDVLGGIKEVKVLGREQGFLEAFNGPSRRFSHYRAMSEVLSELPRYLVEVVGFGAVLTISLYLISQRGDLGEALAIVGIYAVAGYRLLPALHKIQSSLASVRFIGPAVECVLRDLEDDPHPWTRATSNDRGNDTRLRLHHAIRLENVSFRYPGTPSAVIRDLNLTIPAGTITGIGGSSGAGKSTLVDLILGLLTPDQGRIYIDDTLLKPANRRAWQNNVGYVPQHIFLADTSVAANIAFGLDADAIDYDAVERAARLAQIHDVVVGLADGYATVIGERGLRLSGGQRQRLGIARALYHEPDIVVFDEATNALDHETEDRLLDAIGNLAGQRTIIMITHRLASLERRASIVTLDARTPISFASGDAGILLTAGSL